MRIRGLDENIIKPKTIAIVIQMTIDRPPILYALRTVNVRLFVLTIGAYQLYKYIIICVGHA